MNKNEKKASQLGMPHGTAQGKLRKMVIFMLLKKLNANFCHQCGGEIETISQLSIEHKEPWLDSDDPFGKFFDLNNIAFSHLSCNCGAARQQPGNHPSFHSYRKGCRCDGCKEENRKAVEKYRNKV